MGEFRQLALLERQLLGPEVGGSALPTLRASTELERHRLLELVRRAPELSVRRHKIRTLRRLIAADQSTFLCFDATRLP